LGRREAREEAWLRLPLPFVEEERLAMCWGSLGTGGMYPSALGLAVLGLEGVDAFEVDVVDVEVDVMEEEVLGRRSGEGGLERGKEAECEGGVRWYANSASTERRMSATEGGGGEDAPPPSLSLSLCVSRLGLRGLVGVDGIVELDAVLFLENAAGNVGDSSFAAGCGNASSGSSSWMAGECGARCDSEVTLLRELALSRREAAAAVAIEERREEDISASACMGEMGLGPGTGGSGSVGGGPKG
jgi:hypothetical protein